MKTNKAFTLTEILVSTAIIGVLMAITLPVLSKVRKAGRDTLCKANLHSISQAEHLMREFKGTYPGVMINGGLHYLAENMTVEEPQWTSEGYERKQPFFCLEDNRLTEDINETGGFSYWDGYFNALAVYGRRYTNVYDALPNQMISRDWFAFHEKHRNVLYYNGAVKSENN